MKDYFISYTPSGPLLKGQKELFLKTRLMLHELVSSKELIWSLFVRDFRSKYRQSILGVLWAILMPLITVGVFVGMNRSGILTIKDVGMPYPLYAIIGLTIWNLFSIGITASSNALISAGSLIAKINFPKVSLVIAASAQSLVEFFIRLSIIAILFIYYSLSPHWYGLLKGLICLIPIYLFMLGIGFVLSLVAGVVRDVLNILNLALMGFMLLTPVLYPISGRNIMAKVNIWNPLNYLVNVPRDFIVKGHSDLTEGFLLSAVFSVIIFYLGWKLFFLAQNKIAERI